jgi:CRP-like cAMP-binding protein
MSTAARDDVLATLRADEWFAALPPELAAGILRNAALVQRRDGEIIFATGDPADGIYAVLAGSVRMVHMTREGLCAIYYFVQAPSWFGELSELDGGPRVQDAVAVGPVHLLHLSHVRFRALVDREPRFWAHFAALMAGHARGVIGALAAMTTQPAAVRIARHLVAIHRNAERVPWSRSRPALTQEALAAMAGVSRQTVSGIVKQWERDGIVRLSYRTIEIADFGKLNRIADHDEASSSPFSHSIGAVRLRG